MIKVSLNRQALIIPLENTAVINYVGIIMFSVIFH